MLVCIFIASVALVLLSASLCSPVAKRYFHHPHTGCLKREDSCKTAHRIWQFCSAISTEKRILNYHTVSRHAEDGLCILTHFYSILSEAYLWERKTAGFELHTFVEINSGSLKYFWKKTSFLDLNEKINTTLIATYFKTKATRLHYYLVEQQWIITITSHCHHNEVKWKELLNSH